MVVASDLCDSLDLQVIVHCLSGQLGIALKGILPPPTGTDASIEGEGAGFQPHLLHIGIVPGGAA